MPVITVCKLCSRRISCYYEKHGENGQQYNCLEPGKCPTDCCPGLGEYQIEKDICNGCKEEKMGIDEVIYCEHCESNPVSCIQEEGSFSCKSCKHSPYTNEGISSPARCLIGGEEEYAKTIGERFCVICERELELVRRCHNLELKGCE